MFRRFAASIRRKERLFLSATLLTAFVATGAAQTTRQPAQDQPVQPAKPPVSAEWRTERMKVLLAKHAPSGSAGTVWTVEGAKRLEENCGTGAASSGTGRLPVSAGGETR